MEWLREVGAFMVFLSSALFLQKRTWATHQLDGFVTVAGDKYPELCRRHCHRKGSRRLDLVTLNRWDRA